MINSTHDTLHLVEGPDFLPQGRGLIVDFVYPGDDAMVHVGVTSRTNSPT